MIWKTKNKIFLHNPTYNEVLVNLNSAYNAFVIDKLSHIHFIVDSLYIQHNLESHPKNQFNCNTDIGEFIKRIVSYTHNKDKEFNYYNGNSRIHITIIDDNKPSHSLIDGVINLFNLNLLPENRYTVEVTTNFYFQEEYIAYRIFKPENRIMSRWTMIPESELHNRNQHNKLIIAGFEKESIVDGPGFRYVIFVQGCPHHCEGCHNPDTWEFNKGNVYDIQDIFKDIIKNPMLKGVTFSGGEPFMQPLALYELYKLLINYYTSINKKFDFMCYTGFKLNTLQKSDNKGTKNFLNCLDYIVDDRFDITKKTMDAKFRGSYNQKMYEHNKSTNTWTEIYSYIK